jgi:hypothetical protein
MAAVSRPTARFFAGGRTATTRAIPQVAGVTQVSANAGQTCGLKSDGTIACWGQDAFTPPAGTFTQVRTPCAISAADATVVCWGQAAPAGNFTQISAGSGITCGVKTNGFISCAGAPNYCGSGADPWCPVCNGANTLSQVSVGGGQTACGLNTDGTISCWGGNMCSNCSIYPNCPKTPAGAFTQISVGNASACALKADGSITCWQTSPRSFPQPPADAFTQISVGGSTACGTKSSDSTVVCWGGGYGAGDSPL